MEDHAGRSALTIYRRMTREIVTKSAQETEAFAARAMKDLGDTHVVALEGNLGAGKTVFVKGIARALKIKHIIQSPTFVIMRVYPVNHKKIKKLVHVDCYRLRGSHELLDIGLADYIADPASLVVIEWAERIHDLLPPDTLTVIFERQGPSDIRKLIVSRPAGTSKKL